MKKSLIVMIVAIAFCACGSPEKTAQKLIKDYLGGNLKDPNSYEVISFGGLDSTFSSVYSNPEFKELNEKCRIYRDSAHLASLESIMAETREQILELDEVQKKYSQLEQETESKMNAIRATFKGELNGWKMVHKYRAKNGFGALDIYEQTFQLDKELTKVTGVK